MYRVQSKLTNSQLNPPETEIYKNSVVADIGTKHDCTIHFTETEQYMCHRRTAQHRSTSRSFKVTNFGTNLKLIYDFLLVNSTNTVTSCLTPFPRYRGLLVKCLLSQRCLSFMRSFRFIAKLSIVKFGLQKLESKAPLSYCCCWRTPKLMTIQFSTKKLGSLVMS